MYQGRQAASSHAAGERHDTGQLAMSASADEGQRRRIGLAPVPESARAAREFTAATLRAWRLDALIEDAVVIASELATNAIQHGTPNAGRHRTPHAGKHGTANARKHGTANAREHGTRTARDHGTPNAIQHGSPAATDDGAGDDGSGPPGPSWRGHVELSLCLQGSRLVCVVTDQAGTPPALGAAGPEAESGHGLQIVGALAVAWGWTILGTGDKAVWAALDLPGAASAAAEGEGQVGWGGRAGRRVG